MLAKKKKNICTFYRVRENIALIQWSLIWVSSDATKKKTVENIYSIIIIR